MKVKSFFLLLLLTCGLNSCKPISTVYNHTNESRKFNSNELKIVQIHRFEGISNPDDSSILYAIESQDGFKGLLVDAYGVYAYADKTEFMKNVEIMSE